MHLGKQGMGRRRRTAGAKCCIFWEYASDKPRHWRVGGLLTIAESIKKRVGADSDRDQKGNQERVGRMARFKGSLPRSNIPASFQGGGRKYLRGGAWRSVKNCPKIYCRGRMLKFRELEIMAGLKMWSSVLTCEDKKGEARSWDVRRAGLPHASKIQTA